VRALVTGGCGFMGSAIAKRLVEEGHEVTVVDDLSRGRKGNLNGYLDKVRFIFHDMRRPIKFLQGFDVVYDLAARITGIWGLYTDQSMFVRDNVQILLNTLECLKDRIERYFWFSSSCVYNFDGCPLPHKEGDATKVPKTGYDVSKRFGEEIVRVYAEQHGYKYIIARPFNVYGLGESEESPHVVTDFWKRIIEEKRKQTKRFWILGDGNQTRSFTYIKDFVDAVMFLTNRGETGIFNIGTGEETRIIDLLKLMFRIAGLPFDEYVIEHRSSFKEDVQRRFPDITKILKLGWMPKYSLEEGLREMWNQLCDLGS
jgi:nucleoside-diphosphate-sugar epimerase